MGFIYPNKFTSLNAFVIQMAHRCSGEGDPVEYCIVRTTKE